MRVTKSRMNSSGARTSVIVSSSHQPCPGWWSCLPESMPSVRPGLPIPRAVERSHSPTDREELALRIHLAGDAMAQLIEERALETVGEEHAGVSQNERRSLGDLARQLPRPVEEPVPGKHLVDGSPFECLLRRELLPCQE